MLDLNYIKVGLETAIKERSEGIFDKVKFDFDQINNVLTFIGTMNNNHDDILEIYELAIWENLVQQNLFNIELDKSFEYYIRRKQHLS